MMKVHLLYSAFSTMINLVEGEGHANVRNIILPLSRLAKIFSSNRTNQNKTGGLAAMIKDSVIQPALELTFDI